MPDIDIDAPPKIELPVPDVKNDVPNKFWSSVEPYCSEITTSDIQVNFFLNNATKTKC